MLIDTVRINYPNLFTIMASNKLFFLFAAGLLLWFQMRIRLPSTPWLYPCVDPCEWYRITIQDITGKLLFSFQRYQQFMAGHCHWIKLLASECQLKIGTIHCLIHCMKISESFVYFVYFIFNLYHPYWRKSHDSTTIHISCIRSK